MARGMVQLANDRPGEALAALRTAVVRRHGADDLLGNLAGEQKTGDPARALQRMEELERRMPGSESHRCGLAEAFAPRVN